MQQNKLLNLELQTQYYKNFNSSKFSEKYAEICKKELKIFLDSVQEEALAELSVKTKEARETAINSFNGLRQKSMDLVDSIIIEKVEPTAYDFFKIPDNVELKDIKLAHPDLMKDSKDLENEIQALIDDLQQKKTVTHLLKKELLGFKNIKPKIAATNQVLNDLNELEYLEPKAICAEAIDTLCEVIPMENMGEKFF